MSGNYSPNKRQREMNQAQKNRDKAQRRAEKRDRRPAAPEIVSASDIQGGMPSIEEAMAALENRSSVQRSAAAIPARLFVGGLGDDITAQDLRNAFGAHGPVADAVVVVDRETRAPRGFGFVTMENRKDAPAAIEALHGSELKGRSIVVNVATEQGRR